MIKSFVFTFLRQGDVRDHILAFGENKEEALAQLHKSDVGRRLKDLRLEAVFMREGGKLYTIH